MLLLLRFQLTNPMVTVIGIYGEEPKSEFYALTFLILNFVGLFTYYSTLYDSKETWRPAWTDKLG
jgi:hypothetical protein